MNDPERDAEHESPFSQMPKIKCPEPSTLPGFEYAESPVVEVAAGEHILELNHYNTVVVLYPRGGKYEHMDHIIVTDEELDEPYYMFPEPAEPPKENEPQQKFYDINQEFYSLVISLQKMQFCMLQPPPNPMPHVFERYGRFLQSDTSIDLAIQKIIEEST